MVGPISLYRPALCAQCAQWATLGLGENHVACWVSMDSIRHLESKYQNQNGCLLKLMPSPCPAHAQSAQ